MVFDIMAVSVGFALMGGIWYIDHKDWWCFIVGIGGLGIAGLIAWVLGGFLLWSVDIVTDHHFSLLCSKFDTCVVKDCDGARCPSKQLHIERE